MPPKLPADLPPISIVQDTREQKPLLFPETLSLYGRLRTIRLVKATLDAGDYCLEGMASVALVERKGSLREIRQNLLTADIHRMTRALDRLCMSDHPVLLLETSPADLLLPTQEIPQPGPVLQRLLDELAHRRIELLFPGKCVFPAKRRMAGELVLRYLISLARAANVPWWHTQHQL